MASSLKTRIAGFAALSGLLAGAPTVSAAEPAIATIVVTAQKRTENVQDVPLAVSVVSGADLEHINALGIVDLSSLIPSVTFNTGRELRDSSIRIRGIGTDVFAAGIEPSVSTVVDGVVLAQQGSFFNDVGDIERVEVLRGPQGTLFGKNSSAGVIAFVTRNPDFEALEASANVLLAADNEYRVTGVISAPLSQTTAFRLAAFYRQNDGVVTDANTGATYNDVAAYGARGKLEWRPTASLDLLLSIDAQRFDSNCCGLPVRVASTNPIVPSTGIAVGPLNDLVALGGTDVFAKQENYGASLTGSADLGGYSLTYIGAAREWTAAGDFDVDSTPAHIVTSNNTTSDAKQTSHELRLVSPLFKRADYVLGLFYFDTNVNQTLDRRGTRINLITAINPDGTVEAPPGSALVLVSDSTIKTQNVSLYGQADFRPVDRLTLTAGARFIAESQDLDFVRPLPSPFYGLAAFGPVAAHYSDDATTVKAAARFEWTDAFGTYASYSTGYKGEGVFNSPVLTPVTFAAQPLDAETSQLWELGLRSQWLDRRLTLNLTGFLTKFANYQQQAFDPALGIFVVTNAGDIHTNGVEFEFAYAPSERLSISGGVTYLDAGYDYSTGPCYAGQTPALGCVGGRQDLRNGSFINAPDLRFTLLARYTHPLSAASEIYGQINFRWQDDVQFAYDQNPRFMQPAYGITDLTLGVTFAGGRYEASAFLKNAFDQQYVSNVVAQGAAGGGAIVNAVPRDFRRFIGVELAARF
ncbi:MAG TPA: TonB-dependent receptor [Steroidobacteraceae bacterium]|nr:TonB-dependent receptor [Steroidobacteraceae bacterium]